MEDDQSLIFNQFTILNILWPAPPRRFAPPLLGWGGELNPLELHVTGKSDRKLAWLSAPVLHLTPQELSHSFMSLSLICGVLFVGIGFRWYGHLQIYELYYVVAAVWIVEILWSHIWLRYFRFGPLEWLWRSLTYWKKQPMKRSTSNVDSSGLP